MNPARGMQRAREVRECNSSVSNVRIGCAGWAIRRDCADVFGRDGTHLERYAATFDAVEINSCFYRPHRRATYERWAASVPTTFRFAVKMPRAITHERKLVDTDDVLARFLDEVAGLGSKLGPVLVQLPPRLSFDSAVAPTFFAGLRARFDGDVVCEPRHATWFEPHVESLLASFKIARVAADPALVSRAALPGAHGDVVYFRMHGSPTIYVSSYGEERLAALASALHSVTPLPREAWCIFDNTARGAAPFDAIDLATRLIRAR